MEDFKSMNWVIIIDGLTVNENLDFSTATLLEQNTAHDWDNQ
jgi:hypothetical protein